MMIICGHCVGFVMANTPIFSNFDLGRIDYSRISKYYNIDIAFVGGHNEPLR
jgi:hypothetical protein